ncbi:MAG: GxxExxY protein [Planctomycetota bacterium]
MGPGFLEAVYQECLELEPADRGIPFASQPELTLGYKQHVLAKKYRPDFICFSQIILDIKAKHSLDQIDRAQVINYLKATSRPLGLLVNFCNPDQLEYQRLVPTHK